MIRYKLVLAGMAMVFAIGMAGVVGAATVDVSPTGTVDDVRAVQQAILNAGEFGTVILHSTDANGTETAFDFEDGSCLVPFSITIQGEDGGDPSTGTGMTTIENGEWSFVVSESDDFPAQVPINAEISNIHFNNQTTGVILVVQCGNFTALNNRITADTMEGTTYPDNMAFGILLMGVDTTQNLPDPTLINGMVLIGHNYFNLESAPVTSPPTWSTSSITVQYTQAVVVIEGNQCVNDTGYAVTLVDNAGFLTVRNNDLQLGDTSDDLDNAHGIVAFQEMLPGSEPMGNVAVIDNTVACHGEKQIGITLGNYDVETELGPSLVHGNTVTLDGGYSGIALAGQDSSYVAHNVLSGDGEYGVIVVGATNGDEFGPADNNVLAINDLSGLTATVSNVYFDGNTDGNVLAGDHGTVVDEGEGNLILDGTSAVDEGEGNMSE